MLFKSTELPDWISRGLEDLFPFNISEDSDQNFIKREKVIYTSREPIRDII